MSVSLELKCRENVAKCYTHVRTTNTTEKLDFHEIKVTFPFSFFPEETSDPSYDIFSPPPTLVFSSPSTPNLNRFW